MVLPTENFEKDKVDDVLRLPGLKFPKGGPLIGKKNIDLLIALGALEAKTRRAGKQLIVVRRLYVLFGAAIRIQKEGIFDIDSDRFNAEVLQRISIDHADMCKYLTPKSLRLALDLYVKGFVLSGWKHIPKPPTKPKQIQSGDPAQGDAAMPSQDIGEKSLEILKPIQPVADRVKLEQVVKEWMIIRSTERRKKLAAQNNTPAQKATAEKPKFLFKDVDFPQQQPNESIGAYMVRLQNEFQDLHRKKQAKYFVLTYVSDQRRQRLDQQLEEIDEYKNLSKQQLEEIDGYKKLSEQQHDEIEGYKELSEQRLERLDEQHDEIEGYKNLSEQRRERLDQQFDQIQALKKRTAAMQHDLDTHADVFGRQDDVIHRQNQLNDKLNEAIGLQVIILKLELAIILRQDRLGYRQDAILGRQDAIMDGQDAIIDGQDAIIDGQDAIMRGQDDIMDSQDAIIDGQNTVMQGQDKIMYTQGYITGKVDEIILEQDKVMQRQDEALARAVETMDRQREALTRQEDERRTHERRTRALETLGITPEGLDEGLLVFRPGFQPGRFPESYERSTGPRGL